MLQLSMLIEFVGPDDGDNESVGPDDGDNANH